MKADVLTLDGAKAGQIELKDSIFGLKPRPDILHRVVNWQLAKRRAGTHKVKSRGEVSLTNAKMYAQKGTGRARHGSARANLFVGGGRAFGPKVRDHGTQLPKKVRALGLKVALSAKAKDKKLIVIETTEIKEAKTAALHKMLGKLGLTSALFIDGKEVNAAFARALKNIPQTDVLSSQGLNVYDILRRETLVLTKAAVQALEERFA
ncbi:MAG TPA: 50S ribosomal protein L4 [Sphingomonadales bacterium]|nr:50S ribosomal protein L4 [Sphingomonadales bacterium]